MNQQFQKLQNNTKRAILHHSLTTSNENRTSKSNITLYFIVYCNKICFLSKQKRKKEKKSNITHSVYAQYCVLYWLVLHP